MPKDITIQVIPRSSRTEIVEESDRHLKIKLTAAPTNGKANAQLIELLAKHYAVSKSQVEIVKGLTARFKIVKIYSNS